MIQSASFSLLWKRFEISIEMEPDLTYRTRACLFSEDCAAIFASVRFIEP